MSLLLTDPSIQIPKKSTFICSVPSAGNIGQLATDVLLASCNQKDILKRIGCIESECVLPLSGYDSFSTKQSGESYLCMPIEVYSISDKNIFIIHQRSPCVIGLNKKYCEELVEILGTLDAEQVIILTGAETDDIEIMNRAQKFVARTFLGDVDPKEASSMKEYFNEESCTKGKFFDITKSLIRKMNEEEKVWKEMLAGLQTDHYLAENDFDSFLASSSTVFKFPELANKEDSKENGISIETFGMNQATILFQLIMKMKRNGDKYINLSIVGMFCLEGDNREDGKKLAFSVLSALGLLSSTDKEGSLPCPMSWNVLFGFPLSDENLSMFY